MNRDRLPSVKPTANVALMHGLTGSIKRLKQSRPYSSTIAVTAYLPLELTA
jgi:hypothetical protein